MCAVAQTATVGLTALPSQTKPRLMHVLRGPHLTVLTLLRLNCLLVKASAQDGQQRRVPGAAKYIDAMPRNFVSFQMQGKSVQGHAVEAVFVLPAYYPDLDVDPATAEALLGLVSATSSLDFWPAAEKLGTCKESELGARRLSVAACRNLMTELCVVMHLANPSKGYSFKCTCASG